MSGHSHHHELPHVAHGGAGDGAGAAKILVFALAATLAYIAVTVVYGLRAHSLALISEAGHNFSDFLALLLSWVAVFFQARPANPSKSYGYARAGVLVAFINALTLVAVAAYIFYEAVARLAHPSAVASGTMMIVAAIGVVLNGTISWMLYRGAHGDVNIRSALIHQVGDTLSTAAVIVGGWLIAATGAMWIDPALSIAIAALVLWSSLGIIRETLNILLEGTPRGIDVDQVLQAMSSVAGVNEVHDLHVWSLSSQSHALSCHIAVADIQLSESEAILREVKERLAAFRIVHTTIQFEHAHCEVAHGCVIPTDARHEHAH